MFICNFNSASLQTYNTTLYLNHLALIALLSASQKNFLKLEMGKVHKNTTEHNGHLGHISQRERLNHFFLHSFM